MPRTRMNRCARDPDRAPLRKASASRLTGEGRLASSIAKKRRSVAIALRLVVMGSGRRIGRLRRLVGLLRFTRLDRHAIRFAQPAAHVDELATRAAEGP